MLREESRLPYGVIQRYLKWRYRLGLSVGELVALVRGAAGRGQEEYNRLQQRIRASPVVYGYETGWREDGRNGYLWSLSTPEVRCFLRRASRGRQAVAEVLDPPAAGHPPTEGEIPPTPGPGPMDSRGDSRGPGGV